MKIRKYKAAHQATAEVSKTQGTADISSSSPGDRGHQQTKRRQLTSAAAHQATADISKHRDDN